MEKPTIKSNVTLEGVQKNNRKYKDTCTLYVFWYTKVYIKIYVSFC